MTELKNVKAELSRFRLRLIAAAVFVLFAFGLLLARLVVLQVVRHEELSTRAENNRIAVVPVVPNRGLIVDRNGVVLANNYSAYTLEITPSKVEDLDATIDALVPLVDVTPRDRKRFKRLLDESKSFESLPIRTRLTDEEVARFTAQRFRFPGVDIKARLFRNYPLGEVGAHLIGYIGRINQTEKTAMEDWPEEQLDNYRGTEYIGKLGIEQSYESELHGITGFDEVETSAGGRAVRRLKSHPATPGNKLVLSIDIRLQALVEELFGDRRGALVAMDPRSGEILAFVSKPTFDPNLFVDGIDVDSWRELNESIDKPLLNRALRGTYPPGSTFKPFMAMAALATGKRTPNQTIYDGGTFQFGNHTFRSHGDGGLGQVDMTRSIVKSSNVYYYSLANDMGVDLIHDQLEPFGLGRKTGIDVEGEVTGLLPSTTWKKKAYKKPEMQKWYAGETISLGIGQGYNNFTMLQLSSALSTLVSGGQRYKPRLVRQIEDVVTRERRDVTHDALEPLPLKPEHVQLVMKAMHGVTQEGTSTRVFSGAGYQSGGKTGTAQAVGVRQNEKYNASKLEEHRRDHSLYTAFAPLDNPTIALAVIVENAGFGAAAAAPIARRVIDYELLGRYPSVEDIALTREGKSGPPIGAARAASAIPLPGNAPSVAVTGPVVPTAPVVMAPAPAASAAPAPAPAASAASSATPARGRQIASTGGAR
ncbi:penicillin-binding protein 2 [Piscinibacter gummiphilus]|uniref:Peptidoglycan D,D-transpeptidase MrdA n=1 Tax=Piscinibacter gummiphilus TaxID=946333 RepID=A0A1W6L384_9BURK|nr:penicillin-binding protein 2 [Piscinibacter gummiphilus]ARN18628.1 penicillin-binding protein 2 [Piscinibacter gummiphilus]ATU63257.1 penicillin-binding protein 2 [Piscinibacter gummiphilus]GLS95592.1 penicillin-binding protein [Piscinibacter gummiphilus]